MSSVSELPLIAEPDELRPLLGAPGLRVVDLGDAQKYRTAHIPGAVHLEFSRLVRQQPPAMGLLPLETDLSAVFSELGLTPDTHVVACDSEGGGRASRLLWTLEVVGHPGGYSLLNGGTPAWIDEGHPTETGSTRATPTDYPVSGTEHSPALADQRWLLENLDRPDLAILDARSEAEFCGQDVRAARGGHIPGAANLDWLMLTEPESNRRLRPAGELLALLESRGISRDREVVTHCQTHHRSALSWLVLKALGYERVRGYPGSWSEWGNDPDTPVER